MATVIEVDFTTKAILGFDAESDAMNKLRELLLTVDRLGRSFGDNVKVAVILVDEDCEKIAIVTEDNFTRSDMMKVAKRCGNEG